MVLLAVVWDPSLLCRRQHYRRPRRLPAQEILLADCDLPDAKNKATGPRNDAHADRRPDLYGKLPLAGGLQAHLWDSDGAAASRGIEVRMMLWLPAWLPKPSAILSKGRCEGNQTRSDLLEPVVGRYRD